MAASAVSCHGSSPLTIILVISGGRALVMSRSGLTGLTASMPPKVPKSSVPSGATAAAPSEQMLPSKVVPKR